MRCDECKHWATPEEDGYGFRTSEAGLGKCKRIPNLQRLDDDDGTAEPMSSLLAVIDYEVADLCTRANFGCVLFEVG